MSTEPIQYRMDYDSTLPIAEQKRAAEAMERARRNANLEWTAAVVHAIWTTARELETFTVDDVWERFERVNTHNSRTHLKDAIGPLMKQAAKDGAMHGTPEMRRSRRDGSHGNPLTVWCSRVFRKGGRNE